jgi:hypothetical protein
MCANMLASSSRLCVVAGALRSARAESTFRNDTADRAAFNLRCRNGSDEIPSIGANRRETYRYANGVRDARSDVATGNDRADDSSDDDVDGFLVSDRIHDAGTCVFFRDAVGCVEVDRFR